jgi:hypothetical protein
MSNYDEKLEEKLHALENGVPLDRLVKSEDTNSSETGSLVRLAAEIRTLPHPERSPQKVQADKKKIIKAAQEKQALKVQPKGSRASVLNSQWLFVPILGGLALMLMIGCILVTGAGYYLLGPLSAHRVMLTDLSGKVQVANLGSETKLRLVSNGDMIGTGQRIITGDDSWVTLEFFDGSQTTLSPNTDLALNKIDGNWGDVIRVKLTQKAGLTEHEVIPLRGGSSEFSVMTPTGSASVKGTTFNILVENTGQSLFKVESGSVLVTNEESEAYIVSGQGIITEPGKPLSKPNFLFVLQGVLDSKEKKVWSVSGVPVTVRGGTRISGNLEIGDFILVGGYIKGNEWIADSVQPAFTDDHGGAFTGFVDSIEGNQWKIGGNEVIVESGTPGSESINVGDMVRVTFELMSDGTWLALRVESLEGDTEYPQPPPPIDPEAHPELSFEQEEVEVTTCSQGNTLSGTIVNKSDEPEDIAVDVLLGFTILQGKEYVEQVTIFPSSWEEILPGKSHVFDVNVAMKEAWMEAPVESEVKLRIYFAREVNWPDQRSRMTMTIISDCESVPPTEETPDDDEEPPDEDGGTCTGADPHPKGSKLASEYGVPYDMIMTWFCYYNLGFGEIDLMLGLSKQYGVPVDQILDMRIKEGLGWGRIKQIMADQYESDLKVKGKSEQNKNKDKPNKKKDK